MLRHLKICLYWIAGLCIVVCFLCKPVLAEEVTESTEETASTSVQEQVAAVDQKVIDNVNGNLGNYWASEQTRLSGKNPETHWLYRPLLNLSNVCKRAFLPVALLSIIVGIVLQVASGLNKPLRRTGKFVMIGFPILAAIIAYGVPIVASIFFYGA